VLDRIRAGETLVRTLVKNANGTHNVVYHYHPSDRPVAQITAEEAIASGELTPGGDGLFAGADQTWHAKRKRTLDEYDSGPVNGGVDIYD